MSEHQGNGFMGATGKKGGRCNLRNFVFHDSMPRHEIEPYLLVSEANAPETFHNLQEHTAAVKVNREDEIWAVRVSSLGCRMPRPPCLRLDPLAPPSASGKYSTSISPPAPATPPPSPFSPDPPHIP